MVDGDVREAEGLGFRQAAVGRGGNRIDELAALVMAAARGLSRRLGAFRPPVPTAAPVRVRSRRGRSPGSSS